jgi:hypothetical protein
VIDSRQQFILLIKCPADHLLIIDAQLQSTVYPSRFSWNGIHSIWCGVARPLIIGGLGFRPTHGAAVRAVLHWGPGQSIVQAQAGRRTAGPDKSRAPLRASCGPVVAQPFHKGREAPSPASGLITGVLRGHLAAPPFNTESRQLRADKV